jgi:hypothetical protein
LAIAIADAGTATAAATVDAKEEERFADHQRIIPEQYQMKSTFLTMFNHLIQTDN